MAIVQIGLQGSVGESEGARRWARAGVPFMTADEDEFIVRALSGQQRTVEITPGVALVCGVMVTETVPRTLSFEANVSASPRYDLVVLRLEWAGLGGSTASLQVKTGGASPPVPTRNPGVVYEAVLAVVQVAPNTGQLTGSAVYALTPHGGKGGAVYVPQSQYLSYLDIEEGTEVVAVDNGYRWRKSVGGTFEIVEAEKQPWSTWDPNLRTVDGTPVILGTGGVQRGRYKVIRNMCFAEVEIRRGTAGSDFRFGDLMFSLPPDAVPTFPTSPSSRYLGIQWMMGHLFTMGGGSMDWRAQIPVNTGWADAGIWTPTRSDDVRMRPWRSADSSYAAGTGIPWINGYYSQAEVFTAVLRYAVRVD